MLTRVDDADAWQTSQLQREFAEVLEQAGSRADTVLRLPDIRALLDGQLAGRPTRANFRTGTLTVCTMVPMRSVPHRVVCLVGLDDGVFPRLGVVDGDDVLARNPMTGERDIRSEDRQLLLDAVGAATEKLVITYTGANEYTGPTAPARGAAGRTARHPRHDHAGAKSASASSSNIRCSPSTFATSSPASWCPTSRSASTRPCCARRRSAPANAANTPSSSPDRCRHPPPTTSILADLVGFFKDPVKGFFRALRVHAAARRRRCRKTPCPSTSTPSRSGPSATGCWATSCAA